MPEQFIISQASVPSSSTTSVRNATNSIQKLKLKLGECEWSEESNSELKLSTVPNILSKQFSSRSIANHPINTSTSSTSFKVKYFTSANKTFLPQRSHPRETILDIRRRSPARDKSIVDDITLINAVKANYRFIYRINDGVGTVNTILQQVCEERGWREFQEIVPGNRSFSSYERAMRSATGWNLWWSYSIYQFSPYKYLRHWQFTNHNPKGFQFCNKLYLTMYLRKMKVIHGAVFYFYPLSFIVPEDYIRLSMEHTRRATESLAITTYSNLLDPSEVPVPVHKPIENSSVIISKRLKPPLWIRNPLVPLAPSEIQFSPIWISKPVAQSQGKGIFLTGDLTTIATDKKSVVQEYICRPLLIGGYKWDVRIYVCVAAIDPLVIYVHQEGLCRFCTEKYNTADLTQMYSHLTNASLNKLSPAYEEDKEMIGQGCKWPLRRLRQYFKDNGIADWFMRQRIMSMIVLTVIGDALRLGYYASNRNCFDLFGFDVLVDENLKPWLLECNYSPGLGGDSETDDIVKRPMLHELFDLLGFPDSSTYGKSNGQSKLCHLNNTETEGVPSMDDIITYDKDLITRHYFELLMDKMKGMNTDTMGRGDKSGRMKWDSNASFSPEARLMDAKSIYSQNLVVQYLKNQSQGKISHKVREQLISLAAKKLKNKLTLTSGVTKKKLDGKDKRNKSHSPPRVDSATQYDHMDIKEDTSFSSHTSISSEKTKPRPKSAPGSSTSASSLVNSTTLFGTLQKEFPHPDSEAFQKLKHYFDAGVDYRLDKKTGKFKECPALLTIKKDWFNPTKQEGGWVRVYPFDARTTKSPYKSSLTDIRQAVRSVESYLKTAEQIFDLDPSESDDFFRRKIKQTCRRDTEVWVPPLTTWTNNKTYFSPPVIISESNTDCSIITDGGYTE